MSHFKRNEEISKSNQVFVYENTAYIEKKENDEVFFELRRDTSGWTGGIIGMNQVSSEFANLARSFQKI